MSRRKLIIAGVIALGALLTALGGVVTLWWYFDLGHDPVEKLPWLHGRGLEAVIGELGAPDIQIQYSMDNSPGGEFRIELYNTYPPDDRRARMARIKEMTWHRLRYHIAVWMHMVNGEWLVLDTCRWKEGVQF